jgi:streptogramin lyase
VIATGPAPCGTTVARGAVWVGVYETGELIRLDPGTGRITRRVSVGPWACRVALDAKAARITRDRAGELVRVDLGTGRRQRFEVGAAPFDVILAYGDIWVTSFDTGTVAKLDATRRKLVPCVQGRPEPGRTRSLRRKDLGRPWKRGHPADVDRPVDEPHEADRRRNEGPRMASLRPRRVVGDKPDERAPA